METELGLKLHQGNPGMTFDEFARQQTDILMPVVDQFWEQIMNDGFKPHLDEIVQDITKIWTIHQELPFTILSRMPTGIDYWEPTYTEGSFREVAIISLAFRRLAQKGLTEALIVHEGWEKSPDGRKRVGEIFNVMWLCRHDQKSVAHRIRHGNGRKYLVPFCDGGNVTSCNPMFWPWNTNSDILDFFGVPEADRPYLEEGLSKAYTEVTAPITNTALEGSSVSTELTT